MNASLFHHSVNTYMDGVLGRVMDQNHSGATLGSVRVTKLDFVYDAVVFAKPVEVLICLMGHCVRK